MENVEINITPMSLKNGVMGLPIQCCRNWDASGSVEGIFQYAGRKSSITFSPKHKNKERGTAAAWQFTVNDSIQFNQLRMDGIHTYVEEISIGEKLICSLCESGGLYFLTVENVINIMYVGGGNMNKTYSMSIRVSEEELEKLKQAARLETYASYSEFVRRTALLEASKIITENTEKENKNNG